MHDCKLQGEAVSIKTLKSLLESECNIHASKRVIRKVLKSLGYRWGPAKKVGVRS